MFSAKWLRVTTLVLLAIGVSEGLATAKPPPATHPATTHPSPFNREQVDWVGGDAVPGAVNKRSFSEATSKKITVQPSLNGTKVSSPLYVWVIWLDVTIDISDKDNLDPNCKTPNLNPNGPWQPDVGGGTGLGAIDEDTYPPAHAPEGEIAPTYAYALAKMQATGVLSPKGVEAVVNKSAWGWLQTRELKAWDNGVPTCNDPAGTFDGPGDMNCDLDPTATGKIFALDTPGCSTKLGPTIHFTSETYLNLVINATITLDRPYPPYVCSDLKQWSYEARINVKALKGPRVLINHPSPSHIDMKEHQNPYFSQQ